MKQGRLVLKSNARMASDTKRIVFGDVFSNGGHVLGARLCFLNEL